MWPPISLFPECITQRSDLRLSGIANRHERGWSGFPAIRTLGPYVRTHRRHFRQQSTYTVCANYLKDDFDNSYAWRFVSHEDVFNSHQPTKQDLLWKIVLPAEERGKVLRLLDEFNLNAYSLFGSEESLMTLAYREIDLKPLG